ncbi:MAG: hypothetical protein II519_04975, partial [Muribaculaceae bacterium]|nr:hypothetical protein [Muribaculaceae bacterium]
RAAGNRDKQSREDGAAGEEAVALSGDARESRNCCGACACQGCADDGDNRNGNHEVEQERAQIIAGLQQNPNRCDRGNQDIDAEDVHPGIVGERDRMPVKADDNDQDDADTADYGSDADRNIFLVNQNAEDDRKHDEQDRDRRCGEVGVEVGSFEHLAGGVGAAEGTCYDGGKCRHNEQQRQPREGQEQALRLPAHRIADDFADGLASVADRSEQRTEIVDAAEHSDAKAQLALDMYELRILKYIGAYVAEMNGVDIIAFTGGVGENQTGTRLNVCRQLEYLGVKINEAENERLWHGKEGVISTPDSRVKVVVVLTDEEYMIARDTEAIVEGRTL